MNPDGNHFVYADQVAAEAAAAMYRSLFVETVGLLETLAVEIDSLKLAKVAEKLQQKIRDVNF